MPLPTALIALFLPLQATPATMIVGGTIAIARAPAQPRRADPVAAFVAPVETALADAGFLVIPSADHARQVVRIAVTRTSHGAALGKGASGGGGAMPLMGGTGMGGGVSIGLGSKTNVGEMVATELTLSITPRGGKGPAWEGRAVTYQVTGTRGDEPAAVASKLARAIARNFGGPSGLMVSVP